MFSKRRDGVALQVTVDGPSYASQSYGEATYIDASAILDGAELHVFAVNRDLDQPMAIQIDVADVPIRGVVSGELLTGPSAHAFNDFENPDRVRTNPFDTVTIADGSAVFELPPLSAGAVTFELGM